VLDLLFGIATPSAGQAWLFGRPWRPRRPRDAVAAGVAFVPPDRARAGLMLFRSVTDNIAQVRLASSSGSDRMVRRRVRQQRARHWVDQLGIRTTSVARPVNTLSGGNQQKVVLAKWLEVEPRLVLLNDPTRGVDVGGKADLYAIVRNLAAAGATVLFTSTELAEFALLCDRVLVFQAGRVVGTVDPAAATEHVLLEAVNTGRIPPT
jgi:ABC-type sugar transport system ATPase subunit